MIAKKTALLGISLLLVTGNLCANPKTINNWLKNIIVAPAVTCNNQIIFPLLAKKNLSKRSYMTPHKSFKRSDKKSTRPAKVTINEFENSYHTELQISNSEEAPVFIMSGVIFSGKTQNRTLQKDFWAPKKSTNLTVLTYCTEEGQPTKDSAKLVITKKIVPCSVKRPMIINGTQKIFDIQSDVWKSIASSQRMCEDIASNTKDVMDNFDSEKMQNQINEYKKAFRNLLEKHENMIGFVHVNGNEISMELFANETLLDKFWKPLLKSYAMDKFSEEPSQITKKDIMELIAKIVASPKKEDKDAPGKGALYELKTDLGGGTALVDDTTDKQSLIHLCFFEGENSKDDDDYYLDDFKNMPLTQGL